MAFISCAVNIEFRNESRCFIKEMLSVKTVSPKMALCGASGGKLSSS